MRKANLFLLTLLLTLTGALGASAQSCPDDNHPHMIDLGLPSGTKWSCCNVGATTPKDFGGWYSWGETTEKKDYSSYTYQYDNTDIGSNISGTEYDVAYVNSNGIYCMPTYDQLQELYENCQHEMINIDDVKGMLFTHNGASIFLPCGGYYNGTAIQSLNSLGRYWSDKQNSEINKYADYLIFGEDLGVDGGIMMSMEYRFWGHNVRPVVNTSPPTQKEAYAELSTDGETLTFYYDKQRANREGTTFYLNTGSSRPEWLSASNKVKTVVFDTSFAEARPTSCYYWFYHFSRLTTITGIGNLKTKEVTNMAYMFDDCSKLTTIDLSGFNTANVTNMSNMFAYCTSLTNPDVSGFNTANVTNMSNMFAYCHSLTYLDVSGFNTAKATNLAYMFYHCNNLKSLDVSGFNTAKATNLACMFYHCNNLTSLDVSGFNTAKATNMSQMFYYCSNLTSLDVTGFNTAGVTDMEYMFRECESLTSLNLSSFTFKEDNLMTYFMYGCSSLVSLTIPATAGYLPSDACTCVGSDAPCALICPEGFTPDDTTPDSGYFTWKGGHFNYPEAYTVLSTDKKTITFHYDGQRASRSGTTSDLNTGYNEPWSQYSDIESVETIVFAPSFADARPTSCYYWFADIMNLKSIRGIEYLNTSEVTNMSGMFSGCSSMPSIDVSHFDTSKVEDMRYMFHDCNLTSLNLSSFTFKENVRATNFLTNNSLEGLTIPASANNLPRQAFENVGSSQNPCMLKYPDGFILQDSSTPDENGVFRWKMGYFKEAGPKTVYAVLSTDSKTLSFYYDNFRNNRRGTKYVDLSDLYISIRNERSKVESVVFDPSFADARPTSCDSWFYGMENLTSIRGIEYLNTVSVTDMSGMFNSCTVLTDIDLSHFNTANVEDMNGIFWDCYNLKSLDLSSFNTAKVTDMDYMFNGCHSLKNLDLSSFNTASVTSMRNMFYGCESLESLDLSHFNTANVENMREIFWNCYNLKSLDLSSFNTAKVTDMYRMFEDCYELTSLDLSSFTFISQVSTDNFLRSCLKLQTLILPATANLITSGACRGVGTSNNPCTLYAFGFIPEGSISDSDCFLWNGGYFKVTPKESYVVLSTDYETVTFFHDSLKPVRKGKKYELNTGSNIPEWLPSDFIDVTTVVFDATFADARPTDCYSWFSRMERLTSISGIENLNTKDVTDMSRMFYYCTSLESLDLSNFTFKDSEQTSNFLYGCSSLKKLTLPETAGKLNDNALLGVGTRTKPCTLILPENETPEGAIPYEGYFRWKGGYFKTDGLLGDANGDGNVTVADVMMTVNKVMNKPLASFNEKNADINNDGRITVADVMGIVKLVLNSGRASAPRNAYQSMSDAMAVTAKGNELTLHLTGTGSYTASQMTLTLPEGCRLESAQMVSSRSNGHSVQTSDLGNGQYRVMIYGITGLPFGNSCSDLVCLNVKGNHNGDVAVSDIQVVDYLTNTFLLSDVSGIATDIDSIGLDTSGDWYTTQGQKVTTPTRGVYIRNGKKVVVR